MTMAGIYTNIAKKRIEQNRETTLPSPAPQDGPDLGKRAEAPRQKQQAKPVQGVPPPVPRPVRGPVPRSEPLVPKMKRAMRQRQPFDIYEDQYEWLKSVAEAEKDFVNGRGMSQMVREAIDNYRRDHTSSKE